MYIRRDVRWSVILWFSWKHILILTVLSTLVYFVYSIEGFKWIAIPFLPVGTIGTAVAFYVGFKNNSSYERLWEARKIWGAISSHCRGFGMLVCAIGAGARNAAELERIKSSLTFRQISWCNALRLQLRRSNNRWCPGWQPREVGLVKHVGGTDETQADMDKCLSQYLSEEERFQISGKTNIAGEILRLQIESLTRLKKEQLIDDAEESRLLDLVLECAREQAASERIKTFPFPRQYAYFSWIFVWVFMLLLPFGLVAEFSNAGGACSWLVIPFSVLISWMFLTMEQVGDTSEDPFENGINDVPLTAISRNIEIELLEMLGEKNLPQPIAAVADILL